MKPFYAVRRNQNDIIMLSPFLDTRQVISWDDEDIIIGTSSAGDTALKETIEYRLYSAIDYAVDGWIQELKYIPRLINSALAFLVTYFFFSFVVRDPFPVIDEMLLAGGAAVAVYLWTAAKNRKSDLAMKRRLELKNLVDEAEFITDESLDEYEKLLHLYDEMAPLTLADKLSGNDERFETVRLPDNRNIMKEYMFNYLQQEDRYKKILSLLEDTHNSDSSKERLSARLLTMAKNRKIDLPLLALYMNL